jgi:NAD(P)H-flavin reductase/ferredoxin
LFTGKVPVATVRFTPFDRTIECAEGQPILGTALSRGYFLRYGCKHGGCGTCKVLVTDGDVEDNGSSFALTPAERSAGWALACSSRPLSDCVVDISAMSLTEDEFLGGDQVEAFETVVDSVTQLTPTIRGVVLRLLDPPQMRFTAGQFVNVEVPGTGTFRAFSMANPPSANSEIELIVRIFPGGRFSEYVKHAGKGQVVRVAGPVGSLRVRLSYRRILMIAGGSGLAPLLSMLTDLAQKNDRRPVTVFFGARTRDELYYLDRLKSLCHLCSQAEFVPVVEHADEAWEGETGRVTDAIARRVRNLRGYDAYLCGPPPMVEAARALVIQLGVREANVYFDAFVPTGVTEQSLATG